MPKGEDCQVADGVFARSLDQAGGASSEPLQLLRDAELASRLMREHIAAAAAATIRTLV